MKYKISIVSFHYKKKSFYKQYIPNGNKAVRQFTFSAKKLEEKPYLKLMTNYRQKASFVIKYTDGIKKSMKVVGK